MGRRARHEARPLDDLFRGPRYWRPLSSALSGYSATALRLRLRLPGTPLVLVGWPHSLLRTREVKRRTKNERLHKPWTRSR